MPGRLVWLNAAASPAGSLARATSGIQAAGCRFISNDMKTTTATLKVKSTLRAGKLATNTNRKLLAI